MANLQGVYESTRKDGSKYYRASITYKGKHVSLGSFESPKEAHEAYLTASGVLDKSINLGNDESSLPAIHDYEDFGRSLEFKKWVMLINLRDNGLYCNGPIYLRNKYFEYYLDQNDVLRFSAEELFFYTHHTIQRRGNHLFVADYGLQTNIQSRYGIRSFAVCDRDYYFKNGDRFDFRSGNVVIVNKYAGVQKDTYRGKSCYASRIHLNGDLVIGRYDSEDEAAIAYNKAADLLNSKGVAIEYQRNYIEDLNEIEYKLIYKSVKLSGRFVRYCNKLADV